MKTHDQYAEFEAVNVEIDNGVATVRLIGLDRIIRLVEGGSPAEIHYDLGRALTRLREDHSVRVVVITGIEDGKPWHLPAPPFNDDVVSDFRKEDGVSDDDDEGITVPDHLWSPFLGVRILHQALAEMEKPVIAKVNGDVSGLPQTIMFGCDLIVAREDAVVVDVHMDLQDSLGFDTVPGDGGATLVPMHMFPAKAMEYLLLAKPYTAAELEKMGCINYAVPQEQLDRVVDDMVQQLLSKSAYALAMTKRVVKRRIAEQINLTLDASSAYEWINFLHFKGSGGKKNTSL